METTWEMETLLAALLFIHNQHIVLKYKINFNQSHILIYDLWNCTAHCDDCGISIYKLLISTDTETYS